MPLTPSQKIVACSPYRAVNTDLIALMNVLADPELSKEFGTERWAVLVNIERAANNKHLPIPVGFQNVLRDFVAPSATHRRGMDTQERSFPPLPED